MGQLVMCIDAKGYGGILVESRVYHAYSHFTCSCRKWVHVEEAKLEGTMWFCGRCHCHLPDGDHAFPARRFVPLNDPDLKEEPESYDVPRPVRKRRTPEEMLLDAFRSMVIVHPNCRSLLEDLKAYRYERRRR